MNSQETEERNHTQLGRNKGKRDETVSLKFEGFSQKSTQACQWSVLAIPENLIVEKEKEKQKKKMEH
jgi:hypothetical protein